jgi:hypothetical protein
MKVEINNKSYVVSSILIARKRTVNDLRKMVIKYDCVVQGTKEASKNFWSTMIIVNVLVPENRFEDFCKEAHEELY